MMKKIKTLVVPKKQPVIEQAQEASEEFELPKEEVVPMPEQKEIKVAAPHAVY